MCYNLTFFRNSGTFKVCFLPAVIKAKTYIFPYQVLLCVFNKITNWQDFMKKY